MSGQHHTIGDPKVQHAVAELQQQIAHHYPQATFEVGPGEDPDGIYLRATIDVEDTDAVVDVVIDRLLQLQIDEELPIYVVPLRPLDRVLHTLQHQRVHPMSPATL